MVLKQCVACNHRVPASKKTCVCGHVFTQTKMIGGKRYSGYRAMWRSRSDSKRRGSGENSKCRLMIPDEKRVKKRLGSNLKPKQRLSKEITTNEEIQAIKTPIQKPATNPYTDFQSPELIHKLNQALKDINKRIARQSLLWIVLKSSKY